jgi:glutaredoxin-related protein
LIVSGDYGFLEVLNQMKNSKRIVCFANPHMQKGSKTDPHYHEKMRDSENLLDIIKVVNYLSIVTRDDAEILDADIKRLETLTKGLNGKSMGLVKHVTPMSHYFVAPSD